ncbi:MAG: hypothetical protein AB4042_19125 [Leptolyngbyaceae cyanobacterium]
MSIKPPSPIEAINQALAAENPFKPPFVGANNIWGDDFPDLEIINAHASNAIFKALDEIRQGHYKSTSLVIEAENGTGKTHIIGRVRHHLKKQGGALFIFANHFDNLNDIKSSFQKLLANSLNQVGHQQVTQWQELATNIVNACTNKTFKPQELLKRFESFDQQDTTAINIEKVVKKFKQNHKIKDPDICKAILWTLSGDQADYACKWLGGFELSQYKANELHLPSQNCSFYATLQVLELISKFNELVICFDELDVLDKYNDSGLHVSQVIASFEKELFENLNRGVILTVILPNTWRDKVKQLPKSVVDKMTATGGRPYQLEYPNEQTTVSLVSFLLKIFYDKHELIPPNSLYPFDEKDCKLLAQEKLPVRRILKWCQENCQSKITQSQEKSPQSEAQLKVDTPPVNDAHPVTEGFQLQMQNKIDPYLDDTGIIADALFFSIDCLKGQKIEGIEIQGVTREVTKKGGSDKYINFNILGKENGKEVSIGVAVLQADGGNALAAGFRRLLNERNKFGFTFTRACLIRSTQKSIGKNLKKKYIEPFFHENNGNSADLTSTKIQPLFAIKNVYDRRESDYELKSEQIFDFITQSKPEDFLGVNNPLIREILSAPSHQVPETGDEPEVKQKSPLNKTIEALQNRSGDSTDLDDSIFGEDEQTKDNDNDNDVLDL